MSAASNGPATRNHRIALVCVLLVGAALRLVALDRQPLWNDELATWTIVRHSRFADVLALGVIPDVHPPAYAALMHLVVRAFGFDEAVLRVPSALAGALVPAVAYLLGRRLWSRDEGLLAAVIVACAWAPIAYAQEARAYALIFLLASLFGATWLRTTEAFVRGGRTRAPSACAHVVLGAALVYTHYIGLVLVATAAVSQLAWCLWRRRGVVGSLGLHLVVALLFLPWLPIFGEQLERDIFWMDPPSAARASLGLVAFFVQDSLAWGLGALALLAIWLWKERRAADTSHVREHDRSALPAPVPFLALWWCAPVALVYARSLVSGSGFVEYAFFAAAPALYLLLARALRRVVAPRVPTAALAAAVGVALLGDLAVRLQYWTSVHKQDFRGVARAIAATEDQVSDAVLVALCYDAEFFDVHLRDMGARTRVDLLAGARPGVPEVTAGIEAVRALVDERGARHLWFASGHLVPDPEFVEALHAHYEFVERTPRHGAHLVLFEVP